MNENVEQEDLKMGPEYEAIVNMTKEEAADILMYVVLKANIARSNGNSILTMRIEKAMLMAVEALQSEYKEREAGKIV